jgi:hypothetical protein
MKNYILFLTILILTLYGCNSDIETNQEQNNLKQLIDNTEDKKSIKINEFMELFEEIDFDTLHAFSFLDTDNRFIKYQGKKIDIKYSALFENTEIADIIERSEQEAFGKDYDVFGCYKFKIKDNIQGLIVRRYGQYAANRVDLCLWDDSIKKIISNIELAISYGDDGYSTNTESWIYNDNDWKVLTRTSNYKHQKTITDSSFTKKINGTIIKKIANTRNINKTVLILKWKSVSQSQYGMMYTFETKYGEEKIFWYMEVPGYSNENNPYYSSYQNEESIFFQHKIDDKIKSKWFRVSTITKSIKVELADEEYADSEVICDIEAIQ